MRRCPGSGNTEMTRSRSLVVATLSLMVTLGVATVCPAADPSEPAPPTSIIDALSAEVDATVASTRPPHWPMKRACLYYAIAGQTLLAEHGIPARLRVGRVVYRPGTAAAHPIAPHAWLETATDFVDYAMLPRGGQTAVIPLRQVATTPSAVVPGVTRVLAITAEVDASLGLYLRHHYRLFQGRYMRPAARRPAQPRLLSQQHGEMPRQSALPTLQGLR